MKMMRYAIAVLAATLLAGISQAQTTTTTATVVDPDGTVWSNAPYTASVVSLIPPVTSPGNAAFTTSFSGTTNGSGVLSLTLQRVANIYPANATWKFCVTPGVTNPATYCTNVPVGNAGQSSQDISAQINAVIKAPRISGGVLTQGYTDTEFQALAGNQYYNVTSNAFRCYSTAWAVCGGTGPGTVSNGVSYSNLYPGSTVDVRVNACIVDAETRANGNTSGICDARGEGGTQTIASQITLGDAAFDKVALLMPAVGVWTSTMTDGVSCSLEQWGNTSLIGANPAAGINISMAISVGAGSNLAYNYCTGHPINTNGANYYYAQGVAFLNLSTGAVTANNIGNFIQGSYDVSTWDHMDFFDQKDAIDLQVYAVCCEVVIRNSTINANYVGLPLSIIADSTFGVKAFSLDTTSVVHPGPGLAIISATDTGASHVSTLNLSDVYSETSNSDTTTSMYQFSGFGQINIKNLTVTSEVASNGANVIAVANVGTTQTNISGVALVNGAGSFSLPQKVFVDSIHTVTLFSDTSGHFSSNWGTIALGTTNQIAIYTANGVALGGTSALPSGTTATSQVATDSSTKVATMAAVNGTNCTSAASPAVCAAAMSGRVVVAAAATTVVVNTTAVTAASEIQLTFDSSLGTALAVTCNTTAVQPTVSARTAGTSFTITVPLAPTTNPACFSYSIKN